MSLPAIFLTYFISCALFRLFFRRFTLLIVKIQWCDWWGVGGGSSFCSNLVGKWQTNLRSKIVFVFAERVFRIPILGRFRAFKFRYNKKG